MILLISYRIKLMKPSKKRKQSYSLGHLGMAMMEVLVAAGLMGGMAIGLAQLMDVTTKGQKHTQQNISMQEAEIQLTRLFGDGPSCTKSLAGLGLDSMVPKVTQVRKDGSSVDLPQFSPGSTSLGVKLTGLKIVKLDLLEKEAQGQLEMQFDRLKGQRQGEKTNKRFNFRAQLDASNKITQCFAIQGDQLLLEGTCTQLGGTINPSTKKCEISSQQLMLKDPAGTVQSLSDILCEREKAHVMIFGGTTKYCATPVSHTGCTWSGWQTLAITGYPAMRCVSGAIVERAAFTPPPPPPTAVPTAAPTAVPTPKPPVCQWFNSVAAVSDHCKYCSCPGAPNGDGVNWFGPSRNCSDLMGGMVPYGKAVFVKTVSGTCKEAGTVRSYNPYISGSIGGIRCIKSSPGYCFGSAEATLNLECCYNP